MYDVLLEGGREACILFLGLKLIRVGVGVLISKPQPRLILELSPTSPYNSHTFCMTGNDDGRAIGGFGRVHLGRVDAVREIEPGGNR
jgi:hypothetical protein